MNAYSLHWGLHADWFGYLAFEFLDLFYISLQANFTLFKVSPISLEVHYPDFLTGNFDEIETLNYGICSGGYLNL